MNDTSLSLTTPALLFPAISLLFLSYNARFLALAQLVRSLRASYLAEGGNDATFSEIASIRTRLVMIRWMQLLGILSFIASALSMLLHLAERSGAAFWTLASALALLVLSLVVACLEILVSIHALNIHLAGIRPPPER